MLRQAEQGASTIAELCRTQGVSQNTFYKWRQKYGGMPINQAKRRRDLEAENSRLKKLLAASC